MTNQDEQSVLLIVAEDDPMLLLNSVEVLEAGGFEVLTATNGTDATAIIDEHAGASAGLITDIQLGEGPTGWALAHHARSLKPGIAVVYVSGDSASHWPVEGVPLSIFIQKPYADAQMLTAIAELLNGSH